MRQIKLCPVCKGRSYRPPVDVRFVLPRATYGTDVVVEIGEQQVDADADDRTKGPRGDRRKAGASRSRYRDRETRPRSRGCLRRLRSFDGGLDRILGTAFRGPIPLGVRRSIRGGRKDRGAFRHRSRGGRATASE